jgi:hypothetical protein
MFYWFEPVISFRPVLKFPETTKISGNFVGFTDDLGDELSFKIWKHFLITVLHRSVFQPEAYDNHWSKQLSLKTNKQKSFD